MSLVKLPRIRLGLLPTPLHELPNLSASLAGHRLFAKRDDLIGLAMGGNKTRHFEFILPQVKQEGADVIISTAGSQSNSCVQLAAAARRLNMNAAFVLCSASAHPEMQGNLLLQNILASEVRFFGGALSSDNYQSNIAQVLNEVADELRGKGRKPVIINLVTKMSPYLPLAVSGYIEAVEEIWQQLLEQKIHAHYIVVSCASGATYAGLLLGVKLLRLPIKIIGIAAFESKDMLMSRIVDSGNQTAKFLGLDMAIAPGEVEVYDDYLGERHGIITRECEDAIRLVAQTEGIFLDPVYTGKAMAGLIDLIKKGRFKSTDTIVFIHTGGVPALFAYNKEIAS
jgi:D-cysteine desulfhydrase family pyridoxal phosphate-dependent enzyme